MIANNWQVRTEVNVSRNRHRARREKAESVYLKGSRKCTELVAMVINIKTQTI